MSGYYKVLGHDRECVNGGSGSWQPYMWNEVRAPLRPCNHGLHVCTIEQLLHWLGPTIWNAEIEWNQWSIHDADKVVVSRARITTQTFWSGEVAYRFAMDAIQHADPHFANASRKTTLSGAGWDKFPTIRYAKRLAALSTAFDRSTVVPLLHECCEIVCVSEQDPDYRHSALGVDGRDYDRWERSRGLERNWQARRLLTYLLHGMATPEYTELTT